MPISANYLRENFFDVLWYVDDPNATEQQIIDKFDVRGEQISAKKGDAIPNLVALRAINQSEFEAWRAKKERINKIILKDQELVQVLRYALPNPLPDPQTPTHTAAAIINWLGDLQQ